MVPLPRIPETIISASVMADVGWGPAVPGAARERQFCPTNGRSWFRQQSTTSRRSASLMYASAFAETRHSGRSNRSAGFAPTSRRCESLASIPEADSRLCQYSQRTTSKLIASPVRGKVVATAALRRQRPRTKHAVPSNRDRHLWACPQPPNVAGGRSAEKATIFAAELRRAFIPDPISRR